jgi:hypothetical protein
MKTILRIIVILLIAGIVSGGIYALVQNTILTSSMEAEHGQPPAMTDADGQTFQPLERSEGGDEHVASLSRGLAGVVGTLVKLTVITIIVLLLQKGFNLLGNRKLRFAIQEKEQP